MLIIKECFRFCTDDGIIGFSFDRSIMMKLTNVHEYARMLMDLRGDKSEATAAQKARDHMEMGEVEKAAMWSKVRLAIKEMRGSHYS